MWVCIQSMTAIGRRSDWQSRGIGRSAGAEVDASAADSAAIPKLCSHNTHLQFVVRAGGRLKLGCY